MSRIPCNYKLLLKNKQSLRDFCLKPAGLDTPLNRNMPPPPIPTIKFYDLTTTLWRHQKKLSDRTLAFRTRQDVSKPELKQYFKKLYGMDIKKISTIRFMGKVYLTPKGFKKSAAFKKVYLELAEKVSPKLRTLSGQ